MGLGDIITIYYDECIYIYTLVTLIVCFIVVYFKIML